MRTTISITLLVLSILGFGSCKDKENPKIEFLFPEEDIHRSYGQYLIFRIKISDDRGLKSYDYYVGDESGNSLPGFSSNESSSTENREKRINLELETYLTDTLGPFYMYIKAIDKSGKSTTHSRRFYVDP